jgi:HSP20 family protein
VGRKNKKEARAREVKARKKSAPEGENTLIPRDLFSASPFELMRRFNQEMDRALQQCGEMGERRGKAGDAAMWSPPVEVLERDGKMLVRAELPGLAKKDVKVTVADGSLVIEGERKHEDEERGGGFYRSERSYGRFYRQVPMPAQAETSQIRAHFDNGVLEVLVPIPNGDARRREIALEERHGPVALKPGERGPGPSEATF